MEAPEVCILTTAYLPPVDYFRAIALSGKALIEGCESYQKQSWRNRCRIFSTGGPENLVIPVEHGNIRTSTIRDIRIDWSEPWLQRHKRALEAAYNSSAFFDYYRDDLFAVMDRRDTFLFDLNMRLLELLLEMAGMRADISVTTDFVPEYPEGDLRGIIQPKYKGPSFCELYEKEEKTWFQVFSTGREFIPHLSVIDLLCSEGPDAISYL